jgi:hypothetical protein
MQLKGFHINRVIIILFILVMNNISSAQSLEGDSTFIKSLSKNFSVPYKIRENCTGQQVLLLVRADEKTKALKVSFSDNASPLLKEALKNIYQKLETKELLSYIKSKANISLVYPVMFVSRKSDCTDDIKMAFSGQLISQFEGSLWLKPCIIKSAIIINYFDTVY